MIGFPKWRRDACSSPRHLALGSLFFGTVVACTGHLSSPDNNYATGANAGNQSASGNASTGASGNVGSSSGGSSSAGASSAGSGATNTSAGAAAVACPSPTAVPAVYDLRQITQAQYLNAVRDVFDGKIQGSQNYPAPSGASVSGYSTEPGMNPMSEQTVQQIMLAAEDVAQSVSTNINSLVSCAAGSNPGATCAGTFIDKYARRAFRRTPTSDERTLLLTAFQNATSAGASFADSMALVADQMLQLPQFFDELEDAAPGGRALTGVELASRLSFLFWDSIPDDTLLSAAEQGQLTTLDQITAQATRLLASSKADTTLARFFREWTGSKELAGPDKDTSVFPTFNNAVATSINTSFDRFSVGLVRNGGSLSDVLRSTDAYVDANTAPLFGLAAPAAGQWQKVSLDPTKYSGVMTQPLVMASLSHSATTSYVYRGKFVLKHLLCIDPGSPPATAAADFAKIQLPPNPTGKDTAASVEARSGCGGCHSMIDPGGLAFENFDALGQYRTQYPSGKAIDPSGTQTATGSGPITFKDQVDLLQQLVKSPVVPGCFARELYRFSMSRLDTSADTCAVQSLQTELSTSGATLTDALTAIVKTDSFRYRTDP